MEHKHKIVNPTDKIKGRLYQDVIKGIFSFSIVDDSVKQDLERYTEDITDCEQCKIEREQEKKREQENLENSEELTCDNCGTVIGYVKENDLNGSRFYCADCKKRKTYK